MTILIYAAIATVSAAVGFLVLRVLIRSYLTWRGTRLVTCPETRRPAAVKVDAGRAAAGSVLGQPHLRLKDCSRWPKRRNCGQECLRQIEAAPEDCLLRVMLEKWYEGKGCVFCGKPFGEIQWYKHRAGLVSPEGKTALWHEFVPENIPEVLATHLPVCWDCHIAEKFRREFPHLVTDRPWIPEDRPALANRPHQSRPGARR